MSGSTTAENKKQAHQKPPLSVARIAARILVGTVMGFAIAVPVLYVTLCVIVRAIWGEEKNLGVGGFVVVGFVLLAFPMLYGPASAVGVYLVGSRGKQKGSFLATLGCGFLGGLLMLPMLFGTIVLSSVLIVGVERIVLWAFCVLVLLIPPIMATLGINWRRRHKEPSSP